MRIKLFENFDEHTRYEKNINDMLVELGDQDNGIDYKIKFSKFSNNSLDIVFQTKSVVLAAGEDDDGEYYPQDFFKLGTVSEYIYQVVDYFKEIHPGVVITYNATDPAGDPHQIEELNQTVIDFIDNKYVVVNSDGDECSGLVYLSINFKW